MLTSLVLYPSKSTLRANIYWKYIDLKISYQFKIESPFAYSHLIMIVSFFSHQNIHITTRQLLFCGQWWYYLHTYMFVLSKFLCYQQTMRSAIFINDTRKVCHLKNTTYIVHTTAISPKKNSATYFQAHKITTFTIYK